MDLIGALLACVVAATLAKLTWPWLRRIPRTTRIPLLVYLAGYIVTYCAGAIVVAATKGEVLELYWGAAVHLPDDILESPIYWVLLLLPIVVVPLTVRLLHGNIGNVIDPAPGEARPIGVAWPTLLYAACVAYISQNPTYGAAWVAPFDYLEADASTMYSRRGDLLAGMSTLDAAILYTITPLLTFVVVQEALRSRRQVHVALAVAMSLSTVALQLALAQAAPTMVFAVAVLLSVAVRRFGRVVVPSGALGALFVFRYLGVKYASRSMIIPFLEIFLRMPSIYPYYIWFVRIRGYGGVPVVALLTAGRAETPTSWASLVGGFVFPSASVAVHTPAPAHVQAFADGGLLYAFFILVLIGAGIRAVGAIRERGHGHDSTLDRGFYVSACCTIYMTTQLTFFEALYGAYGVLWSLLTYGLLKLLSTRAAHAGDARIPEAAP